MGNSVVVNACNIILSDLKKQKIFDDGLSSFFDDDYDAALSKWTPLAEQGYAKAQNHIGFLYSQDSIKKNDKLAFSWYAKAAMQGHPIAQYNLGFAYQYGEGVLTDYVLAYMWFDIAAYNGNKDGSEKKEHMSMKMTSTQIAKAQNMSKKCLSSCYSDCGLEKYNLLDN